VSDRPGPPTLSLALQSVLTAAVDSGSRNGLLTLVRDDGGTPSRRPTLTCVPSRRRVVVPFPAPRTPEDDDPSAA
jgi:hypothetical protein